MTLGLSNIRKDDDLPPVGQFGLDIDKGVFHASEPGYLVGVYNGQGVDGPFGRVFQHGVEEVYQDVGAVLAAKDFIEGEVGLYVEEAHGLGLLMVLLGY